MRKSKEIDKPPVKLAKIEDQLSIPRMKDGILLEIPDMLKRQYDNNAKTCKIFMNCMKYINSSKPKIASTYQR